MSVKEGEKMQTKDIDNLFENIITENIPNLEKERDFQVQEVFRKTNRQNQKRHTTRYIKLKILNVQNKK
jgi:hypothetical protein